MTSRERYGQSFTFGAVRSDKGGDVAAPSFVGWVAPRGLTVGNRRCVEIQMPKTFLTKWLKVPVDNSYGLRIFTDDPGMDR